MRVIKAVPVIRQPSLHSRKALRHNIVGDLINTSWIPAGNQIGILKWTSTKYVTAIKLTIPFERIKRDNDEIWSKWSKVHIFSHPWPRKLTVDISSMKIFSDLTVSLFLGCSFFLFKSVWCGVKMPWERGKSFVLSARVFGTKQI